MSTSLKVQLIVRGKDHFVRVTDEHDTIDIPLIVTAETPITRKPLLVKMTEGDIPQVILDTLLLEHYKYSSDELWWRDYYLQRQDDQERYADEIAKADREFREASQCV